jgi:hypothetical protein
VRAVAVRCAATPPRLSVQLYQQVDVQVRHGSAIAASIPTQAIVVRRTTDPTARSPRAHSANSPASTHRLVDALALDARAQRRSSGQLAR